MGLLTAQSVALERGYRLLLQGVDFTVAPGELWQMAGPNGIGKTSFLRALAGLSKVGVSGSIQREASFLYQGHLPGLKPLLSPIENLSWHPSGLIAESKLALRQALDQVGLFGYEDTPVLNLSAGQQRRVALARLWLSDAKLWLLDEPFTAIDMLGAELLEARLLAHVEQGGAVVFTSHQPNRFAERLRVLDLSQYAA